MIYPMNIFTADPASDSIRPFIIFVAFQAEFNITNAEKWEDAKPVHFPRGGFVLPFPDGGLIDSVTHTYSQDHPVGSRISSAYDGFTGSDAATYLSGMVPDPMITQVYKGTGPRTWAGTWQIVPQSMGESALVALLLRNLKTYASPDKTDTPKIGMLIQPYVFKIYFSNPLIQAAMNFNYMAITGYSINYFAQGYASTYKDMMPKHIELTMNFAEQGIKYRSDWTIDGIIGNLGF